MAAVTPAGGDARPRRGYLDWMRGLAVLIMIEAHVIDSWTRAADRQSTAFGWSMILGGFGAPLFLFLAGVSVALSASSKFRRLGDPSRRVARGRRRGLEIFLLAFVFRVQAWVLGWGAPATLLKVDILNIMGPSIMAAAALWGLAARGGRDDVERRRYVLFLFATLAMTLLTPIVRATPPARRRARSARGVPPAAPRPHDVRVLPVGRVRVRRRDPRASRSTSRRRVHPRRA